MLFGASRVPRLQPLLPEIEAPSRLSELGDELTVSTARVSEQQRCIEIEVPCRGPRDSCGLSR